MTSESSEKFITIPVLKEMLEIHERAYRTTMQLMMDSVKDDIKSLKQSIFAHGRDTSRDKTRHSPRLCLCVL